MKRVRAHIFISGRIQGIGFRLEMRYRVRKLGLYGFVKNLPDGRVEAVLEGEKEKVEKLIEWAKRGPFLAKVENLEVDWQEYQEEFNNFVIRY